MWKTDPLPCVTKLRTTSPNTVQGPIRRLAATVEQAVQEQALYLQRVADSERAGEWNTEVRCGRLPVPGAAQCCGFGC